MGGRYRIFLCGVTPRSASEARLQLLVPACPKSADHAPMPADYGPFDEIANRRANAGQRQRQCVGCGLWAIWTDGRDVPGWPRQMRAV